MNVGIQRWDWSAPHSITSATVAAAVTDAGGGSRSGEGVCKLLPRAECRNCLDGRTQEMDGFFRRLRYSLDYHTWQLLPLSSVAELNMEVDEPGD